MFDMKLTAIQVKRTQPGPRDIFLNDGRGLYLRIRPTGTKVWLRKVQAGGKTRWITIGYFPAMGLADARIASANCLTDTPTTHTVSETAEQFFVHLGRTIKRPDVARQQVTANLLPLLGEKHISTVTRSDIAAAIQTIVQRGALVSANRTLTYTKQLWQYALAQGYITDDVTEGMSAKHFGGREASRERFLSSEELTKVIHWLLGPNLSQTRLALLMLLLTGQRASEVLGFTPAERAGLWWHIPAQRTKSQTKQKVYLSIQARHVLSVATRIYGQDQPFGCSLYSLAQATRRFCQVNGWHPFSPHDLRRTMSTHLAEQGISAHIIEKMLNHRMVGVMAVYNRAEYLHERENAWRIWGAFLSRLRKNI